MPSATVNISEIIDFMGSKLSRKEEELLLKAYKFSEQAHAGQKRMSGDPYFFHVFETAKILARLGMDTQTVATGLLHDLLEDTKITEAEIQKEFGEEITFLIKGVTKLGTLKYHGHERHVESLRKFFVAMANDLRVVIIKFADRLHNLRTLEFIREEKKESYEKCLAEVREILEKELRKNKIKVDEISYRMKHKYSLYKKLLKYDMDIEKIYDIVALRVVVENVEECYRILGLVHSIWNPLPGRIKDYIAIPKPNGYRSIHTTIFTGILGVAEVQIRTKEMHAEAAYGIAAHFAYKEQNKKSRDDKSKFKWIEELKELKYVPGEPKTFIEHLKMDFFNDRIFIFTPKGDVVDLPEESTPVDFAYSIHSDIGDHMFGSKINGKMSQIFTKLKNGDIVEIITKKDSRPSSKWLEYTKTNVARKNIKSYLEKNSLLSRLKSFGQK